MVTLSSPYLFGGMLVFINVLVTYRTMTCRPLYASIVSVKKVASSDDVEYELSSLDNHSLVGFILNTILPLSPLLCYFSP